MVNDAFDFKPQFYHDFQCVGTDCVDSCCTHWHISVDKPTYQFMIYKSKLTAEARQAFQPTQQGHDFAEVRLDSNQRCPMLTATNLCRIQIEDGLSHLPNTCRLFPRQRLQRGLHLTEHSLLMSCPEATRKILFEPSSMNFDRLDLPNVTNEHYAHYHRPSWYHDVKTWVLQTLEQPQHIFESKLYTIGFAIERLMRYVGHEENFNHHLLSIQQINFQAVLQKQFKQSLVQLNQQVHFFMFMLVHLTSDKHQKLRRQNPRLQSLLSLVTEVLPSDKRPVVFVKEVLSQTLSEAAVSEMHLVWCNYFKYSVYNSDFPAQSMGHFWYKFGYEFIFLRTLILLFSTQGILTQERIILVFQSFHKALQGRVFQQLLHAYEQEKQQQGFILSSPLNWLLLPSFKSTTKATIAANHEESTSVIE
jgi:lysine-N-methylase